MSTFVFDVSVVVLSAAIALSGVSCKKNEQAPAQIVQSAQTATSAPAQQLVGEEIKKDVKAAKAAYAAKVNGIEISMFDLVREMNRISADIARSGNDTQDPMVAARKQALDNLITRELAVQFAIKQGIKADQEQIDTAIKLMKEQMGEKDFQAYLNERSSTEKDLRWRFERNHLFEMITAREIYSTIKVDEKELRAEYEKSKSALKDKDGKQLKYEAAADFIRRKLKAVKGAEKLSAWGSELRKNAEIVIY